MAALNCYPVPGALRTLHLFPHDDADHVSITVGNLEAAHLHTLTRAAHRTKAARAPHLADGKPCRALRSACEHLHHTLGRAKDAMPEPRYLLRLQFTRPQAFALRDQLRHLATTGTLEPLGATVLAALDAVVYA